MLSPTNYSTFSLKRVRNYVYLWLFVREDKNNMNFNEFLLGFIKYNNNDNPNQINEFIKEILMEYKMNNLCNLMKQINWETLLN